MPRTVYDLAEAIGHKKVDEFMALPLALKNSPFNNELSSKIIYFTQIFHENGLMSDDIKKMLGKKGDKKTDLRIKELIAQGFLKAEKPSKPKHTLKIVWDKSERGSNKVKKFEYGEKFVREKLFPTDYNKLFLDLVDKNFVASSSIREDKPQLLDVYPQVNLLVSSAEKILNKSKTNSTDVLKPEFEAYRKRLTEWTDGNKELAVNSIQRNNVEFTYLEDIFGRWLKALKIKIFTLRTHKKKFTFGNGLAVLMILNAVKNVNRPGVVDDEFPHDVMVLAKRHGCLKMFS